MGEGTQPCPFPITDPEFRHAFHVLFTIVLATNEMVGRPKKKKTIHVPYLVIAAPPFLTDLGYVDVKIFLVFSFLGCLCQKEPDLPLDKFCLYNLRSRSRSRFLFPSTTSTLLTTHCSKYDLLHCTHRVFCVFEKSCPESIFIIYH